MLLTVKASFCPAAFVMNPAGHVVAGLRQQGLRLGRVVAVAPSPTAPTGPAKRRRWA